MGQLLRAVSAALSLTLLLSAHGMALAHAIISESSPKAGEVVNRAPQEIVLRFNTRIEKTLSRVTLTGPGDQLVSPLLAIPAAEPDRLVVKPPSLEAGVYLIRWKVLSADGHVTQGAFRFTLAR
jgi:methionine-rich copper-binding protein CopC